MFKYKCMLTPFMATLINKIGDDITFNYRLPIKRNALDAKTKTKVFKFLLNRISQKLGNHAFTLIWKNGKCLIYDPTNLVILDVVNPIKALLLTGDGEAKINTMFSLWLQDGEKEKQALDNLVFKKLGLAYDRRSFINISEDNMDLFMGNKALLDDYYIDNHKNILGAVNASRVRKRN